MDFEQAEQKFRELRARIESGEPISRTAIEELVSQLSVSHEGLSWEINPRTGKWMYFDGVQWVEGAPPMRSAQVATQPRISPQSELVPPPATMPEPANTRIRARRAKTPPVTPSGEPIAPRNVFRIPKTQELTNWMPWLIGAAVVLLCILGGIVASQAFSGTPRVTPTVRPTQVVFVVATSIPAPTLAPSGTPAPPPSQTPVPVRLTVIEALVNVRAAPNTSAEIIVRLQKDATLNAIGRSPDGQWYQIILSGRDAPAWIFGETVTVTSGNASALPISPVESR